ncbi:DUF6236 family protein [Haematobacter massiliensis]|uniref:DUF6236 family protein n=1 Tax=Haematobacter massiliensis TaxID=195105 RepID=UPI0023F28E79|nr:DUF6236 family protein [Haematobacter massiliensis]
MQYHKPIKVEFSNHSTPYNIQIPDDPLDDLEIGAVMFPVVQNFYGREEKVQFKVSQDIDPLELRRAILYWDKIDIPSGLIAAHSDEITELERAGVVRRSIYLPDSEDYFMMFGRESEVINCLSHAAIASKYNLLEKGRWSIQSQMNGLDSIHNSNTISFKIASCIPIPSDNVPINEVLEFRHLRKDELRNFQEHIREVERNISAPGMLDASIQFAIRRLERSIEDTVKVSRESKFSCMLSGLKISVNRDVIERGVIGSMAVYGIIPSMTLAVLTGIASSALHAIVIEKGFTGPKQEPSPLQYISSAARAWK